MHKLHVAVSWATFVYVVTQGDTYAGAADH